MTDTNTALYDEMRLAAESKATGSKVASIIVRAYAKGWETGDIYEALNEGGYDLSFGTIEALGQRYSTDLALDGPTEAEASQPWDTGI